MRTTPPTNARGRSGARTAAEAAAQIDPATATTPSRESRGLTPTPIRRSAPSPTVWRSTTSWSTSKSTARQGRDPARCSATNRTDQGLPEGCGSAAPVGTLRLRHGRAPRGVTTNPDRSSRGGQVVDRGVDGQVVPGDVCLDDVLGARLSSSLTSKAVLDAHTSRCLPGPAHVVVGETRQSPSWDGLRGSHGVGCNPTADRASGSVEIAGVGE